MSNWIPFAPNWLQWWRNSTWYKPEVHLYHKFWDSSPPVMQANWTAYMRLLDKAEAHSWFHQLWLSWNAVQTRGCVYIYNVWTCGWNHSIHFSDLGISVCVGRARDNCPHFRGQSTQYTLYTYTHVQTNAHAHAQAHTHTHTHTAIGCHVFL